MKIKILLVGKTTAPAIRLLEADYEKRIKRYTGFELVVIDNAAIRTGTEQTIAQREGDLILKKLTPTDHLVLLDERGKMLTSIELSEELNHWMNSSKKTVVLLIGGAYGFSDAVKKRANNAISLSKMTFSHQIVRAILLEQVYRAFTILNNEPYHHA